MSSRVHRTLGLEELEPRVAPVTLTASNPTYTFTDASGDSIRVQYSGPGSANVQWVKGWFNPSGSDDLAGIALSGTTSASQLTIQDLNPGVGGDSLTAGTIAGTAGESFGAVQLLAGTGGTVSKTNVSLKNDVGAVTVQGAADQVFLTVVGNLTQQTVHGNLSTCSTSVGGNMGTYQVNGNVGEGKLLVTGDLTKAAVTGNMGYSSLIDVGGKASQVQVGGDVRNSIIRSSGDMTTVTIGGNFANSSRLDIGGHAGTVQIGKDLSDSVLLALGNLSSLSVGGSVMAGAMVGVQGNMNSLAIGKDVTYSFVKIMGDALDVQVKGSIAAAAFYSQGTMNSMKVTGSLTYCEVAAGNMKYLSVGSVNTAGFGGPTLGSFYCWGDMTNGHLLAHSNVDTIYIQGKVTGALNGMPAIEVHGDLKNLTVVGDVKEAGISVGGNVGTLKFQGTTHGVVAFLWGDVSQATFSKAVTWSIIGAWGNTNSLQFGDSVSNSLVMVGGKTTTFKVTNGLKDSWLWLAGGVGNAYLYGGVNQSLAGIGGGTMQGLYVTGGITGGSHITVGDPGATCNVTTVSVTGGMNSGKLTFNGDVTSCTISGAIDNNSSVQVTGNTYLFKAMNGIAGNSTVDLDGQVTIAQVYGSTTTPGIAAGSKLTMGSLKSSLLVTGGMAGTVDIKGSAAGSNIQINGNLAGSLLAGVFGNVSVYGNFTGQIGDSGTAAGTGQLYVTGSSAGGTVNPSNAFATYIGYP